MDCSRRRGIRIAVNRTLGKSYLLLLVLASFAIAGCRGTSSSKPPIHPNLNMDFQEKYDPQEGSEFFADGRAMRLPVAGTVARGMLREDAGMYYGRNTDGSFLASSPMTMSRELLERGQDRFQIYCAPCHGSAGDGNGVIMTGGYGFVPAPTYHSDRIREIEDGHIFNVISNGYNSMPAYGYHVDPEDRWAIVAYIRALQRSQNAQAGDVPTEVLNNIEEIAPNIGVSEQ